MNKKIMLLFIVGLGILAYPHVAQKVNGFMQKRDAQAFHENLSKKTSEELKNMMDISHECNQSIYKNRTSFQDPFNHSIEENGVLTDCNEISNGKMFGTIEIPKLNLLIPIYIGASENVLEKGIGQVKGSSLPTGGVNTHTVLAGHRGLGTKEMFRNIDELHDGDVFFIHTAIETLKYRVKKQVIIYPNETEDLEIQEGKDLATLLTCHPYRYDYQRLLIQAEREIEGL